MGMNFNFDDDRILPPENPCEAQMDVLFLLDKSASMSGLAIRNVEKSINRAKEDICKDPKAAAGVRVCVLAFNDEVEVVQNWCPITEMKPVELRAEGGTNLSGALSFAKDKIREDTNLLGEIGVPEIKKPYVIILSDGYGGNIDQNSAEYRERTRVGKMLPWFLGVPGYDKESAAKIMGERPIFELVDENGFDFTDFFDFMTVSIKAASTSAPGAKVHIKDEENPFKKENCNVKLAEINPDDWLS